MSDMSETVGPVEITYAFDDESENPMREEAASRLIVVHPKYDHMSNVTLADYGVEHRRGDGWYVRGRRLTSLEQLRTHLRRAYGAESLVVKSYEHGGITLSASSAVYGRYPDQQWDVSEYGVVFATAEDMRRWFGRTRVTKKLRAKVREAMVREIETYAAWCEGEVYAYTLTDGCTGETFESRGGFVGFDEVEAEARARARDYIDDTYVRPRTTVGAVRVGERITYPRPALVDRLLVRLDDAEGETIAQAWVQRRHGDGLWQAIADTIGQPAPRVLASKLRTVADGEAAIRADFLKVYLGEAPGLTGVHEHWRDEPEADALTA